MIRADQAIEDDTHQVTLTITGDHYAQILTSLANRPFGNPGKNSITITLTPDQASTLEDQIEDAALEPARCTEDCTNYALPGDGGMCPRHAQDEDAHAVWGRRAL